MQNRPVTTLFMLISVDGKISTGDTDVMDVDMDYKKIAGVRDGLSQYYEIEKTTDSYFIITGAVMTKKCESLNMNNRTDEPVKVPANCIIVDNTHLQEAGIHYLLKKFNSLTVVTVNKIHPAKNIQSKNVQIITYDKKIDFPHLFKKLKNDFGIESLTIQSGGTLNATLMRNGMIDRISLVIAPCLIGGTDTASLIGGESLHTQEDLMGIKALQLKKCTVLENSYLHITYDVINETNIV